MLPIISGPLEARHGSMTQSPTITDGTPAWSLKFSRRSYLAVNHLLKGTGHDGFGAVNFISLAHLA